ncbi:MAG TPA: LD-carboxypeptidase [Candidatus Acidoferrales bacterium]|nr:LD-carboxypeptidase [Candidatus Acidoferrales bacterium]
MPEPLKPPALRPGDAIRVLSLASPVQEDRLSKGCEELARLGYMPKIDRPSVLSHQSFFAGSTADRLAALKEAFADSATRAVFCSRGGYGSNYLVDGFNLALASPKIFLGSSDITSLQIFLWQRFRWVTFYGPMVASNFDRGAGAPHGYDRASLASALTETKRGWEIDLRGESLVPGKAEGILLGGCLTLVEASLGTPWELDTRGAILLLEDRAMKPYQVDRALMHLKQAGKLRGVAGVILGDFPECEPPEGGETVKDVARRVLTHVVAPVVWGAPIGHTERAALTLPLGIRARILAPEASGVAPQLEILEPACVS